MGGFLHPVITSLFLLSLLFGESPGKVQSDGLITDRGVYLFDVRDYGAVGDGKTINTRAVQRALDAAGEAGGGVVFFPPGVYVIGSINLRSNVTLRVGQGATILASRDPNDFPLFEPRWDSPFEEKTHAPLITGRGLENVRIEGEGVIDGSGDIWWYSSDTRSDKIKYGRARFIHIEESRRVVVRDLKLQNSPRWTVHITNSDQVVVEGLTIHSPPLSNNTDGIAINSSHNVRIANNYISTGDDGIVIKAGRYRPGRGKLSDIRSTENVTITNNVIAHAHGGVVFGGEMAGGIRNVTVSNCVFQDTDRGIRIKANRADRAGSVQDLRISNIVMDGVISPIILNMFYFQNLRPRDRQPVVETTPVFRNISISDVTARDVQVAGFIVGLPEMPIEGLTLRNVVIEVDESGSKIPKPAMAEDYTPQRGLIVQNVRDLTMDNVRIEMKQSPAVSFTDVEQLLLEGFRASDGASSPLIVFDTVQHALIRGAALPSGTETFLHIDGDKTNDVVLTGNAFSEDPNVVTFGGQLRPGAVIWKD